MREAFCDLPDEWVCRPDLFKGRYTIQRIGDDNIFSAPWRAISHVATSFLADRYLLSLILHELNGLVKCNLQDKNGV